MIDQHSEGIKRNEHTLDFPSDGRNDGPPWREFSPGPWMKRIDVRDFIVANVSPYEGDCAFLSGPTERTKVVWAVLQPYFRE
jgi:pyruvate-formate lyase